MHALGMPQILNLLMDLVRLGISPITMGGCRFLVIKDFMLAQVGFLYLFIER